MTRHSPLLDQIRSATQETHERVEAAVDIESRTASEVAYGDLLARFYGIYHPLETRLHRLSLEDFGYDLGERTKIIALVRDLEALGWSQERIAGIPKCTDLPRLQTVGEGLGSAYVIEGSTLGGQVITRAIRARSRQLPTNFFNIYGESTRDRWVEFLGMLRAYEDSGAEAQDAVRGADETFAAFERWLK